MAVTSVPCPPLQRSTRSKDTKRLYRCQQLIQRLDGWKQLGLSQCICSPHIVHPPQNHLCVKCHNTSYTLSVHTEWREEGAGGRMLLSVQLKKVRSFVPTPICPHYSATFQWECYAEWRHCAGILPPPPPNSNFCAFQFTCVTFLSIFKHPTKNSSASLSRNRSSAVTWH